MLTSLNPAKRSEVKSSRGKALENKGDNSSISADTGTKNLSNSMTDEMKELNQKKQSSQTQKQEEQPSQAHKREEQLSQTHKQEECPRVR